MNKKTLFLDASHLNVYLIYGLPEVWDFTRIYEVKVETTLCESFLNLFSDVFASESLFRMWDLVIVEGVLDTSERPLTIPSILGALIKRVSTKLNYIYSFQDFLYAIQLEGFSIHTNPPPQPT